MYQYSFISGFSSQSNFKNKTLANSDNLSNPARILSDLKLSLTVEKI